MANTTTITKNVENMWKSPRKSMRKSCANKCEKLQNSYFYTTKSTFSHIFPNLPTNFFTTHPSLFRLKLFHFFTTPTITTTNNLI